MFKGWLLHDVKDESTMFFLLNVQKNPRLWTKRTLDLNLERYCFLKYFFVKCATRPEQIRIMLEFESYFHDSIQTEMQHHASKVNNRKKSHDLQLDFARRLVGTKINLNATKQIYLNNICVVLITQVAVDGILIETQSRTQIKLQYESCPGFWDCENCYHTNVFQRQENNVVYSLAQKELEKMNDYYDTVETAGQVKLSFLPSIHMGESVPLKSYRNVTDRKMENLKYFLRDLQGSTFYPKFRRPDSRITIGDLGATLFYNGKVRSLLLDKITQELLNTSMCLSAIEIVGSFLDEFTS